MKPIVALNFDELKSLLRVAREYDYRYFVMYLIAASHGLRVSEVSSLQRKNFTESPKGLYLTVQRLKGSMKTQQKMLSNNDPLLNEQTVVSAYIRDLRPNDYLFTSKATSNRPLSRKTIHPLTVRLALSAGIARHKAHPHCLKHTTGVTMRQNGANLELIQSALGHKNLSSTAQYLRVTQEDTDNALQKAFSALNG